MIPCPTLKNRYPQRQPFEHNTVNVSVESLLFVSPHCVNKQTHQHKVEEPVRHHVALVAASGSRRPADVCETNDAEASDDGRKARQLTEQRVEALRLLHRNDIVRELPE